jgi:SAM-dependent methyltransferase
VYPTEWVIRTIAGGNYPGMKLDRSKYPGARILDLGCGDGRNLGLLQDLGFSVHATEISDEIVGLLQQKRTSMGWNVEFRRGLNTQLPYEDGFFDYVLSCWSFYYLGPDTRIAEVLCEIARILKPGGYFIAGISDENNSVLRDARTLEDGSVVITNDPFNIRNGTRWAIARDKSDVESLLTPFFDGISVGHLVDDYFGLMVSGFIFVCRRPAA